jgi:hypothetical protein
LTVNEIHKEDYLVKNQKYKFKEALSSQDQPRGTDKFYLSLYGSLAVMHIIDAVLDFFADLLRRTTSLRQEERR